MPKKQAAPKQKTSVFPVQKDALASAIGRTMRSALSDLESRAGERISALTFMLLVDAAVNGARHYTFGSLFEQPGVTVYVSRIEKVSRA